MAGAKGKRLVSVAKELNVGTSTLVDHLKSNGFDIDNKPTAKLTEDMYHLLLKDFQQEIAIKQKAEKIDIGKVRKDREEDEKEVVVSTQKVKVEGPKIVGKVDLDKDKKPAEKPAETEQVKEEPKEVEKPAKEQEKEEEVTEIVTQKPKVGLSLIHI